MDQLNIVGIAGSLRAHSYSGIVLDAVAAHLPGRAQFTSIDIGALPHYDEDLEREAMPQSVIIGRAAVAASDAVIIVTPEFNHGIPGVLKNTLDWLSRPAFQSCMMGKPVMFVTHSPGALGGVRAQYQLRETLASMQCHLVPLPEVAITYVGSKITEGRLTDAATQTFIAKVFSRFLDNSLLHNALAEPSAA